MSRAKDNLGGRSRRSFGVHVLALRERKVKAKCKGIYSSSPALVV